MLGNSNIAFNYIYYYIYFFLNIFESVLLIHNS